MRLFLFVLISTGIHGLFLLRSLSELSTPPVLAVTTGKQKLQLALRVQPQRVTPVVTQQLTPPPAEPTPVPVKPKSTPVPIEKPGHPARTTEKKKKKSQPAPAPEQKQYQSVSEKTRMVDPAEYLNNPPPRYPALARRRGLEGTVLLSVLVSEEGKVKEIHLKESSGVSILDDEARRVVATWRFIAATENGSAVQSRVVVPIRFSLQK